MKMFNIEMTYDEGNCMWELHQEIFTDSPCSDCGKCCKGCATNDGYLAQDSLLSDADIDGIKALFNFSCTRGFVTDHGCNLPLTVRSPTCVAYYCAVPGDELMAGIPTPAKRAHPIEAKMMLAKTQAFRSVLEELLNDGIVAPLEGLT